MVIKKLFIIDEVFTTPLICFAFASLQVKNILLGVKFLVGSSYLFLGMAWALPSARLLSQMYFL